MRRCGRTLEFLSTPLITSRWFADWYPVVPARGLAPYTVSPKRNYTRKLQLHKIIEITDKNIDFVRTQGVAFNYIFTRNITRTKPRIKYFYLNLFFAISRACAIARARCNESIKYTRMF